MRKIEQLTIQAVKAKRNWTNGNTSVTYMKPIYDNRTIVGYANTVKQAQKVVTRLLQTIPKGWSVKVKERDTSIIDLPAGFVYSVSPK